MFSSQQFISDNRKVDYKPLCNAVWIYLYLLAINKAKIAV